MLSVLRKRGRKPGKNWIDAVHALGELQDICMLWEEAQQTAVNSDG